MVILGEKLKVSKSTGCEIVKLVERVSLFFHSTFGKVITVGSDH
jgi:hypothetical protein